MRESLKEVRKNIRDAVTERAEWPHASTGPLRAIAAEMFVATGAAAAVEALAHRPEDEAAAAGMLRWVPLAVAPVAAAAQLEHARNPRAETATALRLLNGLTVGVGGALLVYDLLRRSPGAPVLASFAFASAGLLGLAVDRHESEMRRAEQDMRRRADVVERLVPRRKPKLDRVVVHV